MVAILTVFALTACSSRSLFQILAATEKIDTSKFSYINEDAGFGIIYPEDYNTLTSEEINTLMAVVIEYIASAFSDPAQMEEAMQKSIPVSITMKHPITYVEGVNAGINIIVQKYPVIVINAVDAANAGIEEANKQGAGVMTLEKATAIKIDNKNAAVADSTTTVYGMDSIGKQYYIFNNGYIAIISLAAGDEAELSELSKIIDTIQFIK
jgi:hypothetical protein